MGVVHTRGTCDGATQGRQGGACAWEHDGGCVVCRGREGLRPQTEQRQRRTERSKGLRQSKRAGYARSHCITGSIRHRESQTNNDGSMRQYAMCVRRRRTFISGASCAGPSPRSGRTDGVHPLSAGAAAMPVAAHSPRTSHAIAQTTQEKPPTGQRRMSPSFFCPAAFRPLRPSGSVVACASGERNKQKQQQPEGKQRPRVPLSLSLSYPPSHLSSPPWFCRRQSGS
jgi:hypothetical protein